MEKIKSTTLPSPKSTKEREEGGHSFLKSVPLVRAKNGEILWEHDFNNSKIRRRRSILLRAIPPFYIGENTSFFEIINHGICKIIISYCYTFTPPNQIIYEPNQSIEKRKSRQIPAS